MSQQYRSFVEFANNSPTNLPWWQKFESVAPHLVAQLAATKVLTGDEAARVPSNTAAAVSDERDYVWFASADPSQRVFLRILTVTLWELFHCHNDRLTMRFIETTLNQAVTSGDNHMLRLAEEMATAVSEEGPAGLARLGIYVRPPVAIPVRE